MFARSLLALGLAAALSTATLAAAPDPEPQADVAVVELVELASLQCPFSARVMPVVFELQKKYGAKLAFRYMHLPLPHHLRARSAAIAVEAARRQGKADLMVERLFANQKALEDVDLRGHADALGLDLARYDRDIADPALAALVERDAQVAAAIGVVGTPTFFVNGQKISGAQPIEKFTELIDAELAAAGKASGPTWRASRSAAADANFHKYVVLAEVPPAKVVSLDEPAVMPAPEAKLEGEALKLDTKKALTAGKGKTTVVIFGGPQCPFTARAVPQFLKLAEANADKVTLVYKHLPLAFHPMSRPAAEAVACANEQGKGWALTSAIFSHPTNELTAESLITWSGDAGVDAKKQEACMKAGRGKRIVEQDMKQAADAEIRATPTVLVNGKRLSNWSAPNVEALILAQ